VDRFNSVRGYVGDLL